MQVRKKFRRLKRFAYLGAITGTVITMRRQRARKDAAASVGSPATWPRLEPSAEPPVATTSSWADSAPGGQTDAATTRGTSGTAAVADGAPAATPGNDPVAAVGDLATDATVATDAAVDEDGVTAAESGGSGQAWVEPNDGACPLSHPVKANANSGIYHVPGGRFYERTQAERCYVDAASAEADGYRAAKDR